PATSFSVTEDSAWWARERRIRPVEGPPRGDLRPGARRVPPGVGPGDDDAAGGGSGPGRAAGDDRPLRARAARLGRARHAARRAARRGGVADVRVRRGRPDP